MFHIVTENESLLRLVSFILFLLLFASMESIFPKKIYSTARRTRWFVNFSLASLNTLMLRFAFPLLAVEAAIWAKQYNWGLFHQYVFFHEFLELGIGLALLDLSIYFQHRLFHHLPLFWRLHRVHHSDVALDVTTGFRFHPLEMALSMLLKIGLVIVFGLSPVVVIVFEILLNLSSLFNHANWDLGIWDSRIRKVLVTPDMHRIHHSSVEKETNSNFGFCISLWDRLFQTHRSEPLLPVDQMQIGLENYRNPDDQKLKALLKNPLMD